MKLRTSLLALAVSVLAAGTASAATADYTFNVTITIDNVCTVTVNNLAFGTQTDITSSVAASTTGNVDCTGAGPWAVDFAAGGSGSFATREMASGADVVEYNLYRNSGHTEVLGDGTAGTFMLSGSGDNNFVIYGQTVAGQTPPTGAYSDSIQATVTF